MYKCEMHTHTADTSSCGEVMADDLVRLHKEKGYDGIIITDHYTKDFFDDLGDLPWKEKIDSFLKGYREACSVGKELSIDIFMGMEIRFPKSDNDYLVYGIDEDFLLNNPHLYSDGSKNFYKKYQKDLLVYQAHPFRVRMTREDPNFITGIEVFNGNLRHNSYNQYAEDFAAEHSLKRISGSDFHLEEDLDRGGVIFSSKPKDYKDLINMLKNNEYKIKSI